MLIFLGCIGTLAALVYLVVRTKRPRRFLLSDSFYLGIVIFFAGAVISAYRKPMDGIGNQVVLLSTLALISCTFAAILLRPYCRNLEAQRGPPSSVRSEFAIATTIFLVLFNLGFIYLVYIKLFGGSFEVLSKEGGLLDVRLMIATGERGYFFPGLIKQIRDIFAPIFIYYLLAYTPSGRHRFLFGAVVASTLAAILIGGQRTPLLVVAYALFMGFRARKRASNHPAKRRPHRMRVILGGLLCVATLGLVNQLLGRASLDSSLVQMISESAVGIFERIVVLVPLSNIEAYDFVMDHNFGIGALWLDGLGSFLPGTQVGLNNEMHEYLYGRAGGNAVLGFPISVFVNFGYMGLVLAPMIAMAFMVWLDRFCTRVGSRLLLSARVIMLIYLPIAYSPATFLLSGGLMLLAIMASTLIYYRHPVRSQALGQAAKSPNPVQQEK